MKKQTVNQYVIYSRKSKFTGKGESIENQIELCRQYIAMHYGQDFADNALIYEDEGFSGGNLERPQFQKMMAESQKTQFAAIVVYRLDRISRNIGDFAKLIEDLGQRHIAFISIKEQFDTSSPMGRAMMYIASVFSQLERETIAERIKDNMHELAKTGRWLGGTTPTGFASESETKITLDGKTRKAFHLKVIPDEMRIIHIIFDKFFETGSLSKTDMYLLENHYTTKNGKPFTRFSIKSILTNPVYLIADEAAYQYFIDNQSDLFSSKDDFDGVHGIMAYNRTNQKAGKTTVFRPANEWIVSVGKHLGQIPGEKWVRIQKMLDANSSKAYRRPRSHVALLSGLLICGDCGNFMRPKMTQRYAKSGEMIYTYMCETKERSRRTTCNISNLNGNTLDSKVIDVIKQLSENTPYFAECLEKTKKELSAGRSGYETDLEVFREKEKENEAGINSLIKSLTTASGTPAEVYITNKIQEMHQAGESLRQRINELETLVEHHQLADQEFAFFKQMISSFASNVDDCTIEEKRRLLKSLVRKVIWDGENVHVYLFGSEGEIELPPFDQAMIPLCEDSKRGSDVL